MNKSFKILILSLFVTLVSVISVLAQSRYDDYFIKPAQLQSLNPKNLVILDARGEKGYKKGHIPGALPVSWKQISDMSYPFAHRNWGTVTNPDIVNQVLSELGVRKEDAIVVYADTKKGWGEDGRMFWTLKMAGLSKIKILDGGIHGWRASGGAPTKDRSSVTKTNFSISHLNMQTAVDTQTLKNAYSSYKLIDTRAEDEFNGARKFGEKRGGHLPGAVLIPYADFLEEGYLKPLDQLTTMLTEKGIKKTDTIAAYCTAGIRSAYVQVVLEMLGYPVAKNYDDSFYVWANEPDTYVGRVVKNKTYNFISPDQLKTQIENQSGITLIDIQPTGDFENHHIPGAVSTAAYPVKTMAEKKRLNTAIANAKQTANDIAIICPRGQGGARRTADYLIEKGIDPLRLVILENGQAGWPF